jgi:hypothetical protein
LLQFGIYAGVLFVGLLLLGFVGLVWANYMRQKYLREIKGKMKGVFFAEGISVPIEEIVNVLPNGMEVQAPFSHHIGTYYINRQAIWNTMYPSKPFLGMWFIQVPISTHWWGVDNPEPWTRYRHTAVATPDRIFNSGDTNFMFALRQAKAELDTERKEITKLLKSKLNPTYIYGGLVVILIAVVAIGIMVFSVIMPELTAVAQQMGVSK